MSIVRPKLDNTRWGEERDTRFNFFFLFFFFSKPVRWQGGREGILCRRTRGSDFVVARFQGPGNFDACTDGGSPGWLVSFDVLSIVFPFSRKVRIVIH